MALDGRRAHIRILIGLLVVCLTTKLYHHVMWFLAHAEGWWWDKNEWELLEEEQSCSPKFYARTFTLNDRKIPAEAKKKGEGRPEPMHCKFQSDTIWRLRKQVVNHGVWWIGVFDAFVSFLFREEEKRLSSLEREKERIKGKRREIYMRERNNGREVRKGGMSSLERKHKVTSRRSNTL